MDYREILDGAPLPIVIHAHGPVLYANRAAWAFLRSMGYSDALSPEAIGDIYRFVAPEQRESAQESGLRLLEGDGPVHNLERILVDAKGRRLHIMGSMRPVDWDGQCALQISFVGHYLREDSPLEALTHRERQLVHLVAEGFDTINIAAILGIAEATVRVHLKAIYKKTGVSSRVELTRLVLTELGPALES